MTNLRFIRLKTTGQKEELLQQFIGVNDFFGVFRYIDNFTASGLANDLSSEVALVSVSSQTSGSSLKAGVVVTGSYNKCELRDHNTGEPVHDSDERTVYGRLTQTLTNLPGVIDFVQGSTIANTSVDLSGLITPGDLLTNTDEYFAVVQTVNPTNIVLVSPWLGPTVTLQGKQLVFTLSYYVLVGGIQTPHNFIVPTTLDCLFAESVSAVNLPFESFITQGFGTVPSEIHVHVYEFIPITLDGQTVFALANTPKDPSAVIVSINGVNYKYGEDYTVTGTVLTWLDFSFTLETTDVLAANYAY